jgi:hypothetical protein
LKEVFCPNIGFLANSKLKVQKAAFDAIYCLMKNCYDSLKIFLALYTLFSDLSVQKRFPGVKRRLRRAGALLR